MILTRNMGPKLLLHSSLSNSSSVIFLPFANKGLLCMYEWTRGCRMMEIWYSEMELKNIFELASWRQGLGPFNSNSLNSTRSHFYIVKNLLQIAWKSRSSLNFKMQRTNGSICSNGPRKNIFTNVHNFSYISTQKNSSIKSLLIKIN